MLSCSSLNKIMARNDFGSRFLETISPVRGHRKMQQRLQSVVSPWARPGVARDPDRHDDDFELTILDTSAHAAACLRLRPCQRRPRHAGTASLAGAQEYSAHGALHRAGPGSIYELLA